MVRTLIALLLLIPALVVAREPVSLVEVDLDSPGDQARFERIMGELDILDLKPGAIARLATRPRDLDILRNAGLAPRILEEDMEARVIYPDKGPGFGVFHTRSESIAFVDSLRMLYPNVISEKWSIGLSGEGREIWAFRVSDNPDIDENEPEILIDATHHSREIMAAEFPLMFAEYLAQNYGTDPEITWLLDNRELYLVPIVNPDGFVYNETIEPDGGGMWRKTRRDNGDGTFGVDPNRNYPFFWGFDDVGSSPTTSSETYRGPYSASEPEVQAMMAFINSREFRTQNSVHTHGNLTLFPFGYTTVAAPDEPALQAVADEMARFNGYEAKPIYGLYSVNGGTCDWAYGEDVDHEKIFSFSNEIGTSSDGFWPDESRRGALFQENIYPNIVLMRAAGAFVTVHTPVTSPDPGKDIEPGQDCLLTFTVQNQSLRDASAPLTLTVSTDDPWLQLGAAQRAIGSLAPLAVDDLTSAAIPFSVDAACPAGHLATVTVTVPMPEGALDYSLSFLVGSEVPLVFDDFESGTGNWLLDSPWNLTTEYAQSGTYSLTDSPGGSYTDQQSLAATLVSPLFATGITFSHRHSIESGYDYGRVQIAADGGEWTTVASFSGVQSTWTEETVVLDDYLGQELMIRFLMDTDYSVIDDGWYLDDISILGVSGGNQAPPVPVPDPSSGSSPTYELAVTTGPDPEGGTVVCGFKVYSDALQTQIVAEVADLPTIGGQANWLPPTLPDGDYYWRAWAGDGEVRSDLCGMETFTVSDISGTGIPGADQPSLRVMDTGGGQARLLVGSPAGGDVTVTIYDARGARVRELHRGWLDGGTRTLVWNGRDQHGRSAASGVYFVRATVAGRHLTGRMVLVR